MSYTLIPIIVDLKKVEAALGSKDVDLLRAVIKKYRKEMLGIDALFEGFEEFQTEIKKEYRAFEAGDFSGVDLQTTYDEAEDEDDELDPEDEEFERAYKAAKTEAERKKLFDAWKEKSIREMIEEELDADDDEDSEDQDEPERVLSTGAALVHLVLGGNLDPSAWSQYGYALRFLCEQLGTVADERDSWTSIRSQTFDFADKILKRAGVPPKEFSTNAFLVERGPPVEILEPEDFPYVGYLRRDEVRRVLGLLDAEKIEAALRSVKEDADWAREALGELRGWLQTAAEKDQDLICFYC